MKIRNIFARPLKIPGQRLENWLRLSTKLAIWASIGMPVYLFVFALPVFLLSGNHVPVWLIYPLVALFLIFVATIFPAVLWWKFGNDFSKRILDEFAGLKPPE